MMVSEEKKILVEEIVNAFLGDSVKIKIIYEEEDEDEDWNLAENWIYYETEVHYNIKDVKKCRDLIIKDINEKVKKRIDFYECFKEIINERFGDL